MNDIDMINMFKRKIELLETHYNNILAEIQEKKSKGESASVGENALTSKICDPCNGVFEEQTMIPHHIQPTSMMFSEWIAFYKDKLNIVQNYMIDQRLKELNGLFN